MLRGKHVDARKESKQSPAGMLFGGKRGTIGIDSRNCSSLTSGEITDTMNDTRPTLRTIRAAHERIGPHIHRTPVVTCQALDDMTGMRLFLKCENLQKAGAFKSRGACNAVFSLSEEDAGRGVVTHSSGNHAAALARAASLRGIPAFIVMPSNAPQVKVDAVRNYRGEITFCEPTLEAREQTAARVLEETGAVFVHPYDDPRIIAGQGTAALELLEDVPQLDAIVVPVGGGGLLSGTLLAAKELKPRVLVIAAEPTAADDAYRGWKQSERIATVTNQTIADGLRTAVGEITFPIIHELVDDIILASEERILSAMRVILQRTKLVVEPSSAVPLAALFETEQSLLSGKSVGVILSGGNLDLAEKFWA